METKHSPLIRLRTAQLQYKAACEACPHWDYSWDDQEDPHSCCYDVMEARRELRLARKAMEVQS